jgi:type V secretory pathway adhesin AidA
MKARIMVAAAAVTAAGLTACASTTAGSSGTVATPNAALTASAVAYSLYTHCGIDEANIAGHWYEADSPLFDSSGGNPPNGWDNPYQQGTIRMLSDTAAEFRDAHGHVVRFHLRVNATGPKKVCS